jgi:hypothetical protein
MNKGRKRVESSPLSGPRIPMPQLPSIRKPIMAVVFLTLLAAIWAGLLRMGWAWPPLRPTLAGAHGPLMVSGFLGTLIALERAVALSQRWTYIVPLLGSLGALLLFFDLPAGAVLLTMSSMGLIAIFVVVLRIQIALYTVTMALGAVAWLVGNVIWATGGAVYQAVPWWAGFLVLTIVGERLEISRVLRLGSRSRLLFALAAVLVSFGLLTSLFNYSTGVRLTGLGFVALALWLGVYDIARRTARRRGLTGFIAINLLLGYFWLAIGGLLGLRHGEMMAGPLYDAWIHAIFLGFVFSMIFAHALIILPAITGLSIPYNPILYGPVLLMHLALALRIISDLLLWQSGRMWGGLLNGLAILWFLLEVVALAILARRREKREET